MSTTGRIAALALPVLPEGRQLIIVPVAHQIRDLFGHSDWFHSVRKRVSLNQAGSGLNLTLGKVVNRVYHGHALSHAFGIIANQLAGLAVQFEERQQFAGRIVR